LAHKIRRATRSGSLKPELANLAPAIADLFGAMAECESAGTPETGLQMLRDAIAEFDKEDDDGN